MRLTPYNLAPRQTWVSTTRPGRKRSIVDLQPKLVRCADHLGRVTTLAMPSFRSWLRDNKARPEGATWFWLQAPAR